MEQNEYINQRLEDQINWYSRKSSYNKKWTLSLRIIEITFAAIIPFIAGLGEKIPYNAFIIGSCGIIISISAGLSALNKYHENWIEYRTTSESLKHEKYLFLTKTNPYDSENAFQQLVIRVESLISKENSQWSKYSKTKTSDKKELHEL